MSSKKFLSILFTVFLIFSCLFTRFYKLDWGNGFFFHPDENNMATSLSQLNSKNLNPHFFAYGQFPLYLGFYSLKILSLANNFTNSILILRFFYIFDSNNLYLFQLYIVSITFLFLMNYLLILFQLHFDYM